MIAPDRRYPRRRGLARLLPPRFFERGDDQQRRWRLALSLSGAMAVLAAFGTVLLALVTTLPAELFAIGLGAIAAYSMNLAVLHRSSSHVVASHLLLSFIVIHSTVITVATGHVWTFAPAQAIIVPVIAIQLLDRRSAMAWIVVAQLPLALMIYAQHTGWWSVEPQGFFEDELIDHVFITLSTLVLFVLIAWFQESTRSRAQAASSFKSAVLANMSHELRTPLNGVLGMLQDLEQEPLPTELHERVIAAYRAGASLQGIVDDAIDLVQMQQGHLSVDVEPFDLRRGIEELRERRGARSGPVEVRVGYPPSLPGWFLGDERQVLRVLDKLLDNALKFTEQGHVEISVSYSPGDDHERPQLSIEVEDTGRGIPVGNEATVFELFAQVEDSWDRTRGGTGLGLTVCRGLVRAMGGEIGVRSALGKGSTFWFALPLASSSAPEVEPPPPPSPRASSTAPVRVLVVEDNQINQKVACRLLQRLGCDVDLASHGREALEHLATSTYALVLMDIQMPVMDGLSATQAIRESSDPAVSSVPVVALSAYATAADRQRCMDIGMNGHLGKPLERRRLVSELRRLTPWNEAEPGEPLPRASR